jgi:hypothetical protein
MIPNVITEAGGTDPDDISNHTEGAPDLCRDTTNLNPPAEGSWPQHRCLQIFSPA